MDTKTPKQMADTFVNDCMPEAPDQVKGVIAVAFIAGIADGAMRSQNPRLAAECMVELMINSSKTPAPEGSDSFAQ